MIFFVEDTPGVRQFLNRYMPKSDYYITIDIQIVVDAVKKQSVQNIMKYNNFIMTGDKIYAKTVWNTLMSIYDAGKSSNWSEI